MDINQLNKRLFVIVVLLFVLAINTTLVLNIYDNKEKETAEILGENDVQVSAFISGCILDAKVWPETAVFTCGQSDIYPA